MTRAYSMDLRERVVAAVEAGRSRRAVAKLFRVGAATVIRWMQRQVSSGSCAAKAMGGKRRAVLLSERDWLLARIAVAPDLTVRGLRAELAARGTKVSYDAVWRFLGSEGLSFKKNSARRRAGSHRRRPQARAVEAPPTTR
jgi:transposase